MSNSPYNFQYCQKLIIFSQDWQNVLLVRRRGEADYDGVFSFVGGKMEASDESIAAGIKREKDEEIGEQARVKVCLLATNNTLYRKTDGASMILPHYLSQFVGGDIALNPDEYSEYRWVPLTELASLEPKIANISEQVAWAQRLKTLAKPEDFAEI